MRDRGNLSAVPSRTATTGRLATAQVPLYTATNVGYREVAIKEVGVDQDQSFEVLKLNITTRGTRETTFRQRRLYYSAVLPFSHYSTGGGVQLMPAIGTVGSRPFSGGIGNDKATICRKGSALAMIPENVARST